MKKFTGLEFSDYQHLPVGMILGAKIKYYNVTTNRIRSGAIQSLSARNLVVNSTNGPSILLPWEDIQPTQGAEPTFMIND